MTAATWSAAQRAIALSSEVETGSREENASKQQSRASVLIRSEPNALHHDPEKCEAIFRKDHAQTTTQSAMMIHPHLIAL
jgi:hypothetical protein